MTAVGNSLNYEIRITQLTYSNTSTPVCKLALFEPGSKKSKFYIWEEPEAKRLGINLGWIQTGFTLIEKK